MAGPTQNGDGAWRGEPLPRGRHKLSARAVRASQRQRLIRAMLETVGDRGYDATTVPAVVARARVSRNAFYELFADKTDCFVAACDEAATELLTTVMAAANEPDWMSSMRRGTRDYLRWWQDRPRFARAYFIGLPMAGEPATTQRERAYARFRAIFAALGERAREEQPGLGPLPELVPQILVLSVTELIAEEVRAGRGEDLLRLEEQILFIATKLLADEETARHTAPGMVGR